MFRELGADGVVIGMLKPDGELDTAKMETLVRTAGNMKLTMHRAFDVCRDPYKAMEQCICNGDRHDPDQRPEKLCVGRQRAARRSGRASGRKSGNTGRSRN